MVRVGSGWKRFEPLYVCQVLRLGDAGGGEKDGKRILRYLEYNANLRDTVSLGQAIRFEHQSR